MRHPWMVLAALIAAGASAGCGGGSSFAPPVPVIATSAPGGVDFGTIGVGLTASRTITVTNAGGGTLVGTATTSAPFGVVGGATYSLDAGQSASVVVQFTPTAAAVTTVALILTGGGDAAVNLTGTGTTTPTVSLSSSSLDFGTVGVGVTVTRTVTITNAGGGTLSGSAAATGDFAIVGAAGYSLTPGQSATITVALTPTANGGRTGTVSFTGGGGASVAATGTGTSSPAISTSASILAFGTRGLGLTVDLTIRVTNTGLGLLSGTASAAAPFSIVGVATYDLLSTQSQDITVRFAPTLAGPASGSLDLSGAGTVSVPLVGAGTTAPLIAVSPTALDFGSLFYGQTVARPVTVTNIGGGPLVGSSSIAVGYGSGFQVVDGAYSLLPGESKSMTVIAGAPNDFNATPAGGAFMVFSGGGGAAIGLTASVTGGYTQTVSSRNSTTARFDFGTIAGTTYCEVQLRVNGGTAINLTMNQVSASLLRQELRGLYPGDVISYRFYFDVAGNSQRFFTPDFTFVHRAGTAAPDDFSADMIADGPSSARVRFVPIAVSATSVNLHYGVNHRFGAYEVNLTMPAAALGFEATVAGLAHGDRVDYWFDYDGVPAGDRGNSGWFGYVHGIREDDVPAMGSALPRIQLVAPAPQLDSLPYAASGDVNAGVVAGLDVQVQQLNVPGIEATYPFVRPIVSGQSVVTQPFAVDPRSFSGAVHTYSLPWPPAPGQITFPIALRFQTTQPGPYVGELTLPGANDLTVVLAASAGLGPNPPISYIRPRSIDFGVVPVGSVRARAVRVANVSQNTPGATPLVSTLQVDATTTFPFSIPSGGSFALRESATGTFPVEFSSASVGDFTGLVTVDTTSGPTVIALTATATALVPSATRLEFGAVAVGQAATLPVTITNGGSTTITGTASAAAPFSVNANATFSLAPNASVQIDVGYAPAAFGRQKGTLVLTGSKGLAIPLSGVGKP